MKGTETRPHSTKSRARIVTELQGRGEEGRGERTDLPRRERSSAALDLRHRSVCGEAEGRGSGGVGNEGSEGGKRGADTEKAVAPDGREGGERLRVKAILQTESKVPNSLQYFLTFMGRFAMIAANNTTNKEKFAV